MIDDLDAHVARFREAVESRGRLDVPRARQPPTRTACIVEICRDAGAKLAAKSKSMATEEIGLNEALEAAGVRAGRDRPRRVHPPARGRAPRAHRRAGDREDEGGRRRAVCPASTGQPCPADLEELTRAARRQLRETFHAADVGITGANFGVCETGTVVLVTNEGNGRLVSSLPRVHVALIGMERLVASLADLAVMLRLLARSGTGQRLSTYTTLITGPRREGEQDGPDELHVVILDNGRSKLAGRPLPRDARVHPLRRVPERLPRLPEDGRRRVRARLLGPDGRRARAAAGRARAGRRTCRTRRRCAARAPTLAR